MFDFLDIETSPADGTFWAITSDTCIEDCITNRNTATSDVGQGVAAINAGLYVQRRRQS